MNRFRPLISILLVGTLAAAFYWVVYWPSQAWQNTLKKEAYLLQADVRALQMRVSGLAASRTKQLFPEELVWISKSKADAELALQDAIIGLAEKFEITLIAFGTSNFTKDTAQGTIAFDVEAEGPLGQTQAFLAGIEKLHPKIAIGMLRMRPVQGYSADPIEDVMTYYQITFWAFGGDAS